jgi:tRNA dimethylallyltransferase
MINNFFLSLRTGKIAILNKEIVYMQKTIIITGPTAIGKTSYAIKRAKELAGEILSADSMQIYRYMDIGTAKPSQAELEEVPHHLIDIVDPDQSFTVSNYLERFSDARCKIISKGKTPIVVGGTGLYIKALLEGYNLSIAAPDQKLRDKLRKEAEGQESEYLHKKLLELDPKRAAELHPNDHFRLIRALEVTLITGKPQSSLQQNSEPLIKKPYDLICLTADRELIYARIEQRIDEMLKAGLVKEVQGLLVKGYNKELSALQALGYKETVDHLEGQYSEEEYVDLLKKRTRNFAKRQLTWFRSFEYIKYININDVS